MNFDVKKLFVLFSLYMITSCSGGNDNTKDEPCEDFYTLTTYYCNTANFEGSHILDIAEGERIKNIIASSSETCFIVNGVDWKGESFEGHVGSDTYSKLELVDCNKIFGSGN